MSASDVAPVFGELVRQAGGPLLAVDTSTAQGSVAVASTQGVVEQVLETSALPSDSLLATVSATLGAAAVDVSEIIGMVVGLGPGSFTGLRVALATVKGLAFSARTAVYGVSSLALLAAARGPGRVAVVLNARRGEAFTALYDVGEHLDITPLLDDRVCTLEHFGELMAPYRGNVVALVTDFASDTPGLCELGGESRRCTPQPRAAAGMLLARSRIAARASEDLRSLVPRYLRVSEAERALASSQ